MTSLGFWCRQCQPLMVMTEAHAHGDLEWNYASDCELLYRHRGREVTIPPGHLAIFWAAVPHQLIAAQGHASAVVGVLPLQRFLAWRLPARALQRLLQGEVICGPRDSFGDDQRLLERWCQDLQGDSPDQRDIVYLEAQARFWRLLSEVSQPSRETSPALYALIERLASADEDATVAACAREVGLNPKYASGLFRRYTGLTPTAFRTSCRIDRSLSLLLEHKLTISAVAEQVGFSSESSFYTAFRKQLGLSPAKWRSR